MIVVLEYKKYNVQLYQILNKYYNEDQNDFIVFVINFQIDSNQQQQGDLNVQIKKMEEEVNKSRKEAEEMGLPFNERNFLRRLQRNNQQYFDSADYVLKHGWQGDNKQIYNQFQPKQEDKQNKQPSRMAQCQCIEEVSESDQ